MFYNCWVPKSQGHWQTRFRSTSKQENTLTSSHQTDQINTKMFGLHFFPQRVCFTDEYFCRFCFIHLTLWTGNVGIFRLFTEIKCLFLSSKMLSTLFFSQYFTNFSVFWTENTETFRGCCGRWEQTPSQLSDNVRQFINVILITPFCKWFMVYSTIFMTVFLFTNSVASTESAISAKSAETGDINKRKWWKKCLFCHLEVWQKMSEHHVTIIS